MQEIKGEFNRRGVLQSSVTSEAIAEAYAKCIEQIIDDFIDALVQNSDKLGLNSDQHFTNPSNDALQNLFAEATGCISEDVPWSADYQKHTVRVLEESRSSLIGHIQDRIKLREMKPSVAMSPISISGSQIGNLVVGHVVQSQLSGAVTQLIQKGGEEEQAGLLLRQLIEIIGHVDERHKTEREELFRLIKGLLKEIETTKEERNPSTIAAILERIQKVGLTLASASKLIHFINEKMPELTRLLGFGG
ncbi:MAG: hypothetical protein FJ246_00940 [Nitrospira sp.]|nr:hypothetical protein [Nitrospira sp.]